MAEMKPNQALICNVQFYVMIVSNMNGSNVHYFKIIICIMYMNTLYSYEKIFAY